MHFNRRGLRHAQRLECVEIGLHDAAIFNRDLLIQGLAESVKDAALRDVQGGARVDDMAADVADGPHFVDFHLAVVGDRYLHDLGEIAEMAVIESDAETAPRRKAAFAPARNRAHFFKNAAGTAGVAGRDRLAPASAASRALAIKSL